MFILSKECKENLTNDKKKSLLNSFDNFNKVIDDEIKQKIIIEFNY